MAKDQLREALLFITKKIQRNRFIQTKILLKIIVLVTISIYVSLVPSFVVLADNAKLAVISNQEQGSQSRSKELITISVRNASLKETVLGICRSYHISVMGVETLTGNITATVRGETPEDLIKELGRLYHFSVSKEYNTILIEPDDKALENRELYIIQPEHLPAEALKNIMSTVVKQDKMAVLLEQNEVITHLTSGEKRRVETLVHAVDKEPKQVQLEATIIAMERSYAKEQGFRWSWLSLTGHGDDKTNSYGAVTFGKTPTGEAYKFFVKPELSLMESSGKAVLIAKPSIMAMNGETAHILIGERIPVIEET